MDYKDVDGIVKRQMVLFFVIDTSGSMEIGGKIGIVNNTMREVLPELKGVGGSDVDLKIACLKFSSGCNWLFPSPISAENFQWSQLAVDGVTDLGAACRELADKMNKGKFLSAPSASVAPAVFLMSDGEPTDDYRSGLSVLRQNNWFKYAIKVALAIGSDANQDVLKEFTGNSEAVITAYNPEALKKWIRFISVTSAQIGSKSQPMQGGEVQSKQDAMIDEIKDVQQADPDLSQTSTSADDW